MEEDKIKIMKNIHTLPTDKASRLCLDSKDVLWFAPRSGYSIADGKQNIYITYDEEIKEGWYININTKNIVKGSDVDENWKRIILTTDQDLIKDGVQDIDDEFLEWFIKNPSCEWVYVNESPITNDPMGYKSFYKIIIPKEEPKQETLEEVAEKWVFKTNGHKWSNNDNTAGDNYGSFIAGAKWQQEQDKNKYSEEEVLNFTQTVIQQYKFGNTNIEQLDLLKETFTKQFKNK